MKLITTEDGSHSLFVPELNETYHSFHGAVQESNHVFIKMGLDSLMRESKGAALKVLEVGFGTGLNALLSLEWSFINKVYVDYTSLEAFPVPFELVEKLNYTDFINHESAESWFKTIHDRAWNKAEDIDERFSLQKVETKLEDYPLPSNEYNVVFFDAFAPSKQAELWELEILKKVHASQKVGGVFVTYCAKGQLKRDLRALGYEVETLPGPPGKKEMVRAIKR